MPSLSFIVFLAIFAPSGALMSISAPLPSGRTSFTASVIMALGTGLIAPSPIGTCKPALVTLPMPSPLFMVILPSSVNLTVAMISILSVASMSCPASLIATASAELAVSFLLDLTGTSKRSPIGVGITTRSTGSFTIAVTAALAAAAAVAPVVMPYLRNRAIIILY